MNNWKKFIETQNLDFTEIERIYDKSKLAIELVNQYNPKILENISTIANLSNGAYGIYNSGENKKIIPQDLEQRLIYWGKINKENIGNLPTATIKKYFPEIPDESIKRSDTIRVNVRRIMQEKSTDLEIILEIAATIIHEATHELEREATGTTSEIGPKNAEEKFKQWMQTQIKPFVTKYPMLGIPKVLSGN